MINPNSVKQEPSSLSSSLNNNPPVPPSTPIFELNPVTSLDSLSIFPLLDDDSNETNSGNNPSTSRDPLSPFTHDPFLSSTSFGFDNEMDIGGGLS